MNKKKKKTTDIPLNESFETESERPSEGSLVMLKQFNY